MSCAQERYLLAFVAQNYGGVFWLGRLRRFLLSVPSFDIDLRQVKSLPARHACVIRMSTAVSCEAWAARVRMSGWSMAALERRPAGSVSSDGSPELTPIDAEIVIELSVCKRPRLCDFTIDVVRYHVIRVSEQQCRMHL